MVQMKLDSTGVDPTKSSGFEPYEGPVPKPGVYAATIGSARIKISQAGNQYINVMYLLDNQTTAEKQVTKGCPVFDRVVPGESDIQKDRVAKFLNTVCGKVKANVDHDDVTDGGKVNKIGGKDPQGVKCRLVLARDTDNNGNATVRVTDVFPWPKGEEWPTGEFEGDEDDDSTEEEEEVEEPEEESDEEEEEVEEDEEEEEEDEEEDDEFETRSAELEALDRTGLKAICKEHDIKVLKKHSDDDLREAILEVEFPVEDDEEEGDEEPPF